MASVNKIILVGFLGKSPEIKHLDGGKSVCNFSMATSETWKKDGKKEEKTTWHKIVLWGKLGEIAAEHLSKGSQVYIEGKIDNRAWTDKDNNNRYTTEIIAREMVMLGRGEEKPVEREKEFGIREDSSIPF